MGEFKKALRDALKAKELNPQWPKVKFFLLKFIFNSYL